MYEKRSSLGGSRNGRTAKEADTPAAAGYQTPNRRGTTRRRYRKADEVLPVSSIQPSVQRIQSPPPTPDPMVAEYEFNLMKLGEKIKSLQGSKKDTKVAHRLFQLHAMKRDMAFALKVLRRDVGWTQETFYRRSKCKLCGKPFCKHFDID